MQSNSKITVTVTGEAPARSFIPLAVGTELVMKMPSSKPLDTKGMCSRPGCKFPRKLARACEKPVCIEHHSETSPCLWMYAS